MQGHLSYCIGWHPSHPGLVLHEPLHHRRLAAWAVLHGTMPWVLVRASCAVAVCAVGVRKDTRE